MATQANPEITKLIVARELDTRATVQGEEQY